MNAEIWWHSSTITIPYSWVSCLISDVFVALSESISDWISAMSIIPCDLSFPAAIIPGVISRNWLIAFFHCSKSACVCTIIRVLVFQFAIRAVEVTVFPKPVPAERTPISCARRVSKASGWLSLSVPLKQKFWIVPFVRLSEITYSTFRLSRQHFISSRLPRGKISSSDVSFEQSI